jgi:predicted nucleic acid-binding protein
MARSLPPRSLSVLVIDASVIVAACLSQDGWHVFGAEELVAPVLARSEACSVLHEAECRGEISRTDAHAARDRLISAPIALRTGTVEGPWMVASELGWAKTYDAEYVALARELACRLVTLDARLKRGAGRIVPIIGLHELATSDDDR